MNGAIRCYQQMMRLPIATAARSTIVTSRPLSRGGTRSACCAEQYMTLSIGKAMSSVRGWLCCLRLSSNDGYWSDHTRTYVNGIAYQSLNNASNHKIRMYRLLVFFVNIYLDTYYALLHNAVSSKPCMAIGQLQRNGKSAHPSSFI